MKTKKILTITDSVSMPRPEVPYEKTWQCLLKREFPGHDFIDKSARGSTTTRLVTEGGGGVDLLETYLPHCVILQMGITECAPRLFRKQGLEYFLMNRVMSAGMRTRYIKEVKKRRVRNPALTEVSPDRFRTNLINYCTRARAISARIIIIEIIKPSDLFIQKSPHIGGNIAAYNDVYREMSRDFDNVTVIDVFGEMDINRISLDELHVDARGAEMIFERLKPLIKAL